MKVLIVHNSYQHPGGEDAVVEAEARLLADNGHSVIRYRRSNDELRNTGALAWAGTVAGAVWSSSSYRAVQAILRKERPDVVHAHNTFPLISPGLYFACSESGVPVVQSLHNYRLVCPGGQFLRDGRICEDCVGKSVGWPSLLHACYRSSRPATSAVTAMLTVHRVLRTWTEKVSMYVALTEFARSKFIEGGLPTERIAVKPNFAEQKLINRTGPGDYFLYVGRLSPEKGPQLLPAAWNEIKGGPIPLHVAGDGPLGRELSTLVRGNLQSLICMYGRCPSERVASLMAGARCLIVPSLWYEGFPMSVVEAFSCGLPVIASRIGSLGEIVRDGATGLHFEPGNTNDLAAKVEWAWAHPEEMAHMGRNALVEFESKYTSKRNYKTLMEIYCRAMQITAEESSKTVNVERAKVTAVQKAGHEGVGR